MYLGVLWSYSNQFSLNQEHVTTQTTFVYFKRTFRNFANDS